MNKKKEKLLNELLKNQIIINILCKQKEIMIEFDSGLRLYVDSKSEIQLSVTEK